MRDSSGSFRNIHFIVFPENELDEKRCESREAMLPLLVPPASLEITIPPNGNTLALDRRTP